MQYQAPPSIIFKQLDKGLLLATSRAHFEGMGGGTGYGRGVVIGRGYREEVVVLVAVA